MKTEKISPYAYRILDFLSDEHFQYLQNLFHKNHLQMYDSYEQVETIYLKEPYKQDKNYSEFIIFGKVLSRLWKKEFVLNSDVILCRLNEWWLINEHIDDYSHIQCVLHMTDGWNNGGDLYVEGTRVIPIKNSVVFFLWQTKHRVSRVDEKRSRMSISFWYVEETQKEEMYAKYFNLKKQYSWL